MLAVSQAKGALFAAAPVHAVNGAAVVGRRHVSRAEVKERAAAILEARARGRRQA